MLIELEFHEYCCIKITRLVLKEMKENYTDANDCMDAGMGIWNSTEPDRSCDPLRTGALNGEPA